MKTNIKKSTRKRKNSFIFMLVLVLVLASRLFSWWAVVLTFVLVFVLALLMKTRL